MKKMFNLVASALVAIHLVTSGLNYFGEKNAKEVTESDLSSMSLSQAEYAKAIDNGVVFKLDGKFYIADSRNKDLIEMKVQNLIGFSSNESSPLFNAALTWILIFSFVGIASRKRTLAS